MIMPILAVKDIEASIAFYTDKLGFNHDMSLPGPDGKAGFAIISKGTSTIGLGREDVEGKPGAGVVFMVYLPDETDIDTFYGQVQQHGIPIVEALKTEYWGDRLFSITDPDGYYISLCKTVKQLSVEEIAAGWEEAH